MNEPVVAFEVAGSTAARRVRGLADVVTPLVGREPELALISDAATSLLAGSGGVLLATGDAGLGKSRLLEELRQVLDEAGVFGARPLWLEGRRISYGGAITGKARSSCSTRGRFRHATRFPGSSPGFERSGRTS